VPPKTLIEFMLHPGSYPEKPAAVSLVQTHISWVFIGDTRVYKIKKPVLFDFLDFTTLDRRKFFIEEELRLNRRFSPAVYLELVPISEAGGTFAIGDTSHIIEYTLKMRRVSEENMLYRLLAAGKATEHELSRVGTYLAQVYATIPSNEKSRPFGTLEVIVQNIMENFDETERYTGGPISGKAFDAIRSWSMDFLKNKANVFESRVDQGHIKECHGDLHLQHISVDGDSVCVIDCIEFNERFRYGDVASDVAFLSMDLDYNGHPRLSDAFVDAYMKASGDHGIRAVLRFYKVYRAYVRAKVASFMLDDDDLDVTTKTKAFENAKRYYDLAWEYVSHED
jgi:uncharacterized protein